MDEFLLHRWNADVVEIALWLCYHDERLRMPDGGHRNVLVGEDEDIEATDERVGGRKLVCAVE